MDDNHRNSCRISTHSEGEDYIKTPFLKRMVFGLLLLMVALLANGYAHYFASQEVLIFAFSVVYASLIWVFFTIKNWLFGKKVYANESSSQLNKQKLRP